MSVESWEDEITPCVCERDREKPLWTFVAGLAVFGMLAFVLLVICLTPPVAKGDQEISVKPGRLKKIETKLDGKRILWRAVGDFDLIEDSSGRFATTLFPLPGRYQIFTVTAKGDEPAVEVITIKVEGDVPVPPGPDPKPPTPPSPKDDLEAKIGTAWQMEFAADKLQSAKALAGVYRYGSQSIATAADWGTVFDRMNTQAQALGAIDKIINVQAAIMPVIAKTLPSTRSAKVDAESRAKGEALFTRIATVLEGLR